MNAVDTFVRISLYALAEVLKLVRTEISQPDALDFLRVEGQELAAKASGKILH